MSKFKIDDKIEFESGGQYKIVKDIGGEVYNLKELKPDHPNGRLRTYYDIKLENAKLCQSSTQ